MTWKITLDKIKKRGIIDEFKSLNSYKDGWNLVIKMPCFKF